MADGEHGEVIEVQGELEDDSQQLGEHDAQTDELREHDQTLGEYIRRGEEAGYGAQTATLKRVRKALRNTRQQIAAAEERGRQRALQEFGTGNEQALEALRAQVRAELAAESGRERSFARLGIGPDSPVRRLFENVQGDHTAFERQASLLRAAGVTWDADPVVRQVGQQQVAAWRQQADQAQQNGQPLNVDPAGPVPDQVREDFIRGQVEQMARAQAGGTPPSANGLEDRIRAAAQNPGSVDPYQLAGELNRELDGLSREMTGRSLLDEGAWRR